MHLGLNTELTGGMSMMTKTIDFVIVLPMAFLAAIWLALVALVIFPIGYLLCIPFWDDRKSIVDWMIDRIGRVNFEFFE